MKIQVQFLTGRYFNELASFNIHQSHLKKTYIKSIRAVLVELTSRLDMRTSTLLLLGILLVLLAVTAIDGRSSRRWGRWKHDKTSSSHRSNKHNRKYDLYKDSGTHKHKDIPSVSDDRDRKSSNTKLYRRKGQDSEGHHMDYLRSIGGGAGDKTAAKKLLKDRISRGVKYN